MVKAIAAVNATYALVRGVVYRRRFGAANGAAWAVCGVVELAAMGMLYAASRPTHENGAIVDGGTDINASGGVMEYVRDLLYVSLLVQLLCIASPYALLLLLVVPAYALYAIAAARSSVPDYGGAAQEAPLSRKERRKREREARSMS